MSSEQASYPQLEKNISGPRDVDVLCGRGGAALRHPGNQTYRRLVNLNKGMYITCLKTEKLKISRSIVAAIREQNGRFLEQDGNKGTWFDIGDKKAVEKTSQALREGQPKLRQKMVDMGSAPPDSGISLEHQFSNGMYSTPGINPAVAAAYGDPAYGTKRMSNMQHHVHQPQHMMVHLQARQMMRANDMLPPRARSNNMLSNQMHPNVMSQDLMMMPRLRLSNNAMDESLNGRMPQSQQQQHNGGTGVNLDIQDSNNNDNNMVQISEFSGFGQVQGQVNAPMNGAHMNMKNPPSQAPGSKNPPSSDNSPLPPLPPQDTTPIVRNTSRSSPPLEVETNAPAQIDRRRIFAKMKHSRPASGRFTQRSDQSLGVDGMPDIDMVDSTFSLLSNMSQHHLDSLSKRSVLSTYSDHARRDSLSGFNDHKISRDEYMVLGSRRSLMSGLSRISNQSSDANSIFSDLSRKIGNVSTRSIAMSEISGIEEGCHEDLEDSFDLEPAVANGMKFTDE